MYGARVKNFEEWRKRARELIAHDIAPHAIQWLGNHAVQDSLFACQEIELPPKGPVTLNIPKAFIALAEKVACHRDPVRWHALYAALWRLTHGEKHLLALSTDPLVHELIMMQKAVSRDAHKAKAFVRFRLCEEDGEQHYIAWHNPDHFILPLVGPFFQRRFSVMKWTILTPDQSVFWDGETLGYGEGVPASQAPQQDALEELWRTYYRSTFNPARIKLKAMRREMPVRHWATLPETDMIPGMLAEAPQRVQEMLKYSEGIDTSAADFLPETRTVETLREAAKNCQGCPLYQRATQTVFSVGPAAASLMIVGEQPGDQEDRAGLPFVGPAGQVLNRALAEAGMTREDIYLTNAVKHFKHTQNGAKRIHATPGIREINACKPWLKAEIGVVKPKAILCLGLTAARALIGPGFTMKNQRGKWLELDGQKIMCTYHPSAILRMPNETQSAQMYAHLVDDLQQARQAAL